MQINIRLPRPIEVDDESPNNFEAVKSFLKQMELSIHHAQKSLQEMLSMEKESGNLEPTFHVVYRPKNVEDSGTGEKFAGENAYTDDIEIELYTE